MAIRSALAYLFLLALPKDKTIESLSQRKTLAENTVKSLSKRLNQFRGKISMNRLFVIGKDLGRFKNELSNLLGYIEPSEGDNGVSIPDIVRFPGSRSGD